jgi:hypothetical protein
MMKRRLNSNDYGLKAILVVLLLGGAAGFFHFAAKLLHRFPVQSVLAQAISRLFFWLALVLVGLFVLLLIIEGIQDAVYDVVYRKTRFKRIKAPGMYYECPFCGSRKVREFERVCLVCGKELGEENGSYQRL